MTCLLLSGLIRIATEFCLNNNSKFTSVGFKDSQTLTYVCERPNGSFIILHNIGYFSKSDNYICIKR